MRELGIGKRRSYSVGASSILQPAEAGRDGLLILVKGPSIAPPH
jgi:hypothetical protein